MAVKKVASHVSMLASTSRMVSICWKTRIVPISRSSIVRGWLAKHQPLYMIAMKSSSVVCYCVSKHCKAGLYLPFADFQGTRKGCSYHEQPTGVEASIV